ELTALELKIKSPAFVRGYLGRMLGDRSDSFYQSWLDEAIRLDANCKPGKTIQCGNVCRKPENCKKGATPAPTSTPQSSAAKSPPTKKDGRTKAADKRKVANALIQGDTVVLEGEDGDRYKVSRNGVNEKTGLGSYKITSEKTKKSRQLSMKPDDMYSWLAKDKIVGVQKKKTKAPKAV
ncbi:MAG TPA: hypothetical protein V6C63_13720, partial [Allocoleopsis sp.]